MGRAKIAMEFISKEKARNATYVKRKRGLIKKCHEFSILCNVPLCIIIYPYKEGKQSSQPEVYAFQETDPKLAPHITCPNRLDLARARDPEVARQIINKFLLVPKEEKGKRELNLYDMFDDWKRKADQELTKLRQKNALAKYPTWDPALDGFSPDQLMKLLLDLDQKLELVRQRIGFIKGTQIQSAFDPFFDPAPVSSLMMPTNVSAHLLGCFDLEVVNQFSMFNYHPMGRTQECNRVIPFDPNGFPGQVDPATTSVHDGGGNNNLVMYNMSMMGVGHTYYDHQGPEMVDRVASSYGDTTSLPMSMPMLSNAKLPRQCQMFYDK